MSEFDQGARYATRSLDLKGTLPWLIEEPIWSAWRWQDLLDTQTVPFPGDPDRRFDTAVWFDRTNADSPPLAVVIEFMSRPRREALERLTEYTLRVRRELPYHRDPLVQFDVIGVLVNLTGKMRSGGWGMRPPDTGGLGLIDRVGVRNLSRRSAHDLLAGVKDKKVARAVLVWTPLLAGANDPEVAREWVRLLGEETNPVLMANVAGVAGVFADLAERRGVWRPVLEGWNVERSQYLEEVRVDAVARALRKSLTEVLRDRMGRELPGDLIELIRQQKDVPTLELWLKQANPIVPFSLDEASARRVLGLS